MRIALLALTVAGLVSGCSLHREPGIYPLATDAARARLRQADPGPMIAAQACAVRLDVSVASQGRGGLRWSIRGEGQELAAFAVRLEAVGSDQTRAIVDLATAPGPAPATASSGQPALRQPLQPAVVEFVDAALNGRAFDARRLGDSRSVSDACSTASPTQTAPVEHANPWSDDWTPQQFGAPMANGEATLQTSTDGHEERLEDLPKPDNR